MVLKTIPFFSVEQYLHNISYFLDKNRISETSPRTMEEQICSAMDFRASDCQKVLSASQVFVWKRKEGIFEKLQNGHIWKASFCPIGINIQR